MPRRGRVITEIQRDEEGVICESEFESWEDVMDAGLAPSTLASYNSYLRDHKALRFEVSVEGLMLHLRLKKSGLTGGTGRILANAIMHELSKTKTPVSQDQRTWVAKALQALPPSGDGRDRGAIDATMLAELLEQVRTRDSRIKKGEHRWGTKTHIILHDIAVAWMTGLRRAQLITLRRKDLTRDEHGTWSITTDKIHDPTAGNRPERRTVTFPLQVPEGSEHYYEAVVSRFDALEPDDLICPAFDKNNLNGVIQKMAGELGWPPELKFDGVHCLRHGVVTEVRAKQGLVAAVENTKTS